jgi:hypothetical protein
MIPEISEFSYGFALTHEIANFAGANLRAAPILPSLIEEGRVGGGYDVKLDWSGIPIFLQFKRSDYLIRKSAKPIRDGATLQTPFYRFPIMPSSKSDQHNLLLQLDVNPNEVFYASPRFHLVSELNEAYASQKIFDRSFFIRPATIGPLTDEDHHVAYDELQHFVCSEPRAVEAFDGEQIKGALAERLSSSEDVLRNTLGKTEKIIRHALIEHGIEPVEIDFGREEKSLEQQQLRRISDLALRYFSAQFFVVQRASVEESDIG